MLFCCPTNVPESDPTLSNILAKIFTAVLAFQSADSPYLTPLKRQHLTPTRPVRRSDRPGGRVSASFTSYGYFPSPAGAALASNGSSERPNGTTYYQEYSTGAVPAAGPVSLSTPSRTENHVSQSPLHRDNPYSTRTGQYRSEVLRTTSASHRCTGIIPTAHAQVSTGQRH